MAATTRGLFSCVAVGAMLILGVARDCPAQPQATSPQVVQPQAHGYGSVEAGQEAYDRAELRRRAAMDSQRNMNEALRAQTVPPADYPVVGGVEVPSAEPVQVAWVRRRAFIYGPPAVAVPAPYPPLRAYRGALEPYPLVPRPIYPYGYPYGGYIPQPTGQIQIQIGPGVIFSRPQYGPIPPPQQGVPTPAPPQQGVPTLAPPQTQPQVQPEPVPTPAPDPLAPQLEIPDPPAGVPPAPAPTPVPAPAAGPTEF